MSRNFVAKHAGINRASTHIDKKNDYNRSEGKQHLQDCWEAYLEFEEEYVEDSGRPTDRGDSDKSG